MWSFKDANEFDVVWCILALNLSVFRRSFLSSNDKIRVQIVKRLNHVSVHFVVTVVPKPFCSQSWESIELLAIFTSTPELLLRGLLFVSYC